MSSAESNLLRADHSAQLDGDNWVRVAFLDESGIGSLQHDPFLVVAGVIVDADKSVVALERHLVDLMDQFTPKGVKRPDHFHAMDIWHGKRDFNKEHWPDTLRFAILDALARIPGEFELPIAAGAKDRRALRIQYPMMPADEQLHGCYQIAAAVAILQIETYMRRGRDVRPNELANVYFEQNATVAKRASDAFRFLRSPRSAGISENLDEILPLRKIFLNPSYQEKSDASILQVADFCAWATKRRLCQASGWERYDEKLRPWLIFHEKD